MQILRVWLWLELLSHRCELHDHTLGIRIAGVLFWQHEVVMLDCSCTQASDAVVVPLMQRQLSTL